MTSKSSNQGQIACIGNTLKTAAACSTLLEQDRHVKVLKINSKTASEETIGNVTACWSITFQ